jgi:hypothetical protein
VVNRQNIFDFSRACPEPVEGFRVARSFSSEEALDLEFTEKTLHNRFFLAFWPI